MKKLSAAIRIGKQILETYQCICGDDSTKHFRVSQTNVLIMNTYAL